MEPIINPWFFYFVDKADAIIMLFSIVSFIFIMCSLFMLIDEDKKTKSWMFIYGLIFALIAVLIPSSSTIYKMEIAKQITPDNIKVIGNTTDKTIDSIINKIIEAEKRMEDIK